MIITIHNVQSLVPIFLITFAGIAGGGLGYLIGLRDRAPYGKGTVKNFLLATAVSPFAIGLATLMAVWVVRLGSSIGWW